MANNQNHFIGIICIIIGLMIIAFSLGNLLIRVSVALMGFSLINYGLHLRGLPPLQILIPLLISRHRFF